MSTAPLPEVLLVEPETLLRRTVSLTVRTLGTARISESSDYMLATRMLAAQRYDGAVIALAEGALEVIDRIRCGETLCTHDIPIAVMVGHCDAALLDILQHRQVQRIILKPFRAREVIDTIGRFREFAEHGSDGTGVARMRRDTPAPPGAGAGGD
jgi:CheY-like chemotaxis protein